MRSVHPFLDDGKQQQRVLPLEFDARRRASGTAGMPRTRCFERFHVHRLYQGHAPVLYQAVAGPGGGLLGVSCRNRFVGGGVDVSAGVSCLLWLLFVKTFWSMRQCHEAAVLRCVSCGTVLLCIALLSLVLSPCQGTILCNSPSNTYITTAVARQRRIVAVWDGQGTNRVPTDRSSVQARRRLAGRTGLGTLQNQWLLG